MFSWLHHDCCLQGSAMNTLELSLSGHDMCMELEHVPVAPPVSSTLYLQRVGTFPTGANIKNAPKSHP